MSKHKKAKQKIQPIRSTYNLKKIIVITVLLLVVSFIFFSKINFQNAVKERGSLSTDFSQTINDQAYTAEWKVLSSPNGKYTFKIPTGWFDGTACETENQGSFSVSPIKDGVVYCNSDGFSLINIYWTKTNQQPVNTVDVPEGFIAVSSQDIEVDGIKGKRHVLRAIQDTPDTGYFYRTYLGEERIIYAGIYKNGRSYAFDYLKSPKGQLKTNVTKEFDTLVQTTFKFTE